MKSWIKRHKFWSFVIIILALAFSLDMCLGTNTARVAGWIIAVAIVVEVLKKISGRKHKRQDDSDKVDSDEKSEGETK